jgi:hypothetical protein
MTNQCAPSFCRASASKPVQLDTGRTAASAHGSVDERFCLADF